MNLLPLTFKIATRHGYDTDSGINEYSKNFWEWTNTYAEALGIRDLEFTPVDEDYVFDDNPNKIYLLKRKSGKYTYYIPIRDRNLLTKGKTPMSGLFLGESLTPSKRLSMGVRGERIIKSLIPTYVSILLPRIPRSYSLEGYYLFKNLKPIMNWDEIPWDGGK